MKGIEKLFMSKWKFLIALLWFAGCNSDEYDLNKFAGVVNWNPEFAVPIGTGSYELWDFIESVNDSDSIFFRQPDDFLHIVYSEDSIFTYDASEMVVIPSEQEVNAIEVGIGELSIANSSYNAVVTLGNLIQAIPALNGLVGADGMTVPFPALAADDGGTYSTENMDAFQQVEIAEGQLSLSATNGFSIDVDTLRVELRDDFYGLIGEFTFPQFTGNTTQTKTIDLAGKNLSNNLKLTIVRFVTDGTATPILIDFSEKVDFLFEMKEVKIKSGSVKIPAQDLSTESGQYTLDAGGDIKLYETAFHSGTIEISIGSDIQFNGEVKINLPATDKDGAPLDFIIFMNKNQPSVTVTEDVSGAVFNLASDQAIPYNTIPFEYTVSLSADDDYTEVNSEQKVWVNLALKNLELDYAKGDFGNQTVELDQAEFVFNSDIFELLGGDFRLLDPRINLIVHNKDVGVSALIDAQFTAHSADGQQVELFNASNLDHGNLILKSAVEQNHAWTTQILSINKDNSAIVEFIALPPGDKITYGGTVRFNSGANVTPANPNFITQDAGLIIGMEVDLPLQLQTTNLRLADTIAVDSLELDGIKNIELFVGYKNGLPFDIVMELQFVDTLTLQQFGDAKNIDLLQSPEVDEEGKAIGVAEGKTTIELSAVDIENLSKANGIAFDVRISTPKDGELLKPAKLYATDNLELSFGVIAGFDISEF